MTNAWRLLTSAILRLRCGEALLERVGDLGMKDQLAVERLGDGFAGQVVFGRAEAAGEDQDLRAGDGARGSASASRSRSSPITDLVTTSTPRLFSSRGEVEGVGVDALRRQHLASRLR